MQGCYGSKQLRFGSKVLEKQHKSTINHNKDGMKLKAKSVEINTGTWWLYRSSYSFAFNTDIIQFKINLN